MRDVWEIEKVKEVLPQRYPFLFIDKVLEVTPQERKVICVKNVTINDYFFQGHFPANPIMPGVIIIEAMAQAAIISFSVVKPDIVREKPDYYLGKVEAKFYHSIKPGDQLIIHAEGEKFLSEGGVVKVCAKVEEKIAATGRIVLGVKPRR